MKRLKKINFLGIMVLLALTSVSQNIGINSTGATPHNASILDLNTGNTFASPNGKGFLPPNVSLTSRTDVTTIMSPPASLLVYNTASAGTGTSAVSPGYYYFDGTVWVAFIGPFANSQDWTVLGNAGTTPTLNFLGTTDNTDLVLRTNNMEAVRVAANGNVGIGTSNPANKMEVFGGWYNNINQNGFSGYASSVYSGLSPLHASHFIGVRARGTALAPLQPLTGDVLATFQGRGLSGGFGGMSIEASENQSPSALGAKIRFHTVPNGSIVAQDRMVIESDGKVGIGIPSPQAQLDVASTSTVGSDAILRLTRNAPNSIGFINFHSGLNTGAWSQLANTGDKSMMFSNDLNPNVDDPTGLLIAPWSGTANPTGANKGLKIMENGNVGIGVSIPNNRLEITHGTAGNSGLRFSNLTNAAVLATNSLGDVIPASIVTATANGLFWSLAGNAGTTPGTNFLGTTDNNDLVFKTNNMENARITASMGAVCIGTTTPFSISGLGSKLHISQSTFVHLANNNYAVYNAFAYNTSSNVIGAFVGAKARGTEASPTYPLANDVLSAFYGRDAIDCYAPSYGGGGVSIVAAENFSSLNKGTDLNFFTTNTGTNVSTEKMIIKANGNVGIGLGNPAFRLDIAGTANCTSNTWTSDQRKKNNIQNLNIDAIQTIMQLRPVTFNWNTVIDDGMKGLQSGFIAQELEKVLPNSVVTVNNSEKSKSVKYLELLPVLVKAIQEQQAQIELLKNENNTLKQNQQRLNDLEAKVNTLLNGKVIKGELVDAK